MQKLEPYYILEETDNMPETTEIFGCPTDNIPKNKLNF